MKKLCNIKGELNAVRIRNDERMKVESKTLVSVLGFSSAV